MAFAFITSASALKQGNSAGSGNTSAIDTTGANLIVICVSGDASVLPTDFYSNTWTALTATQNVKLYYCYNPTVGSGHTFAVNAASSFASISVAAFSGSASSPFDQENGAFGSSGQTSRTTGSVTPTEPNELLVMGLGFFAPNGGSASIDIGTVLQSASIIGGSSYGNGIAYDIQTTATTRNPSWSWPSATTGAPAARIATFKAAATGITFDAAGNSGDQAAASSYSGSATWSGTNRMLAVDVSMLGAGVTVTAMTYGGANCTFVGAISTVTSFGRVEQWRICSSDSGAPAAGSNTLSITLSGSLEFAAEWVSYAGVHQTVPTEGFNSAQATNAGSATDASVSVTSVADNCWIHGAVVANDTSITANQTTRNNISGTLGSGGNEDNNGPKTPAGAVTMSYTGMGITTTWAIAGYAIRPLAASGNVFTRVLAYVFG